MLITLENGSKIKLPDFLIVGAAKSGTTSLYHYLSEHPQVFPPFNKELYFFTSVSRPEVVPPGAFPVNTFDEYIKAFQEAGEMQITGEATPDYLPWHEVTIANIKKYHPRWKEMKIIILLRDPAERAFSSYNMFVRFGRTHGTFDQFYQENQHKLMVHGSSFMKKPFDYMPDYVRAYGLYHESVADYLDTFPNVKIFLYEDLKRHPLKLYQETCEFLGIDKNFVPQFKKNHNPGGVFRSAWLENFLSDVEHPIYRFLANIVSFFPKLILSQKKWIRLRSWMVEGVIRRLNRRRPKLSQATRKKLVHFYREDIQKLESLIKRDLGPWLRA